MASTPSPNPVGAANISHPTPAQSPPIGALDNGIAFLKAPFSSASFGPSSVIPNFSASTQEILDRVGTASSTSAGSPAWEAARKQVLRSIGPDSNSLETFPATSRPRGGGVAAVKMDSGSNGTPIESSGAGRGTPGISGRGRGRGGRPRGRGRGSGRGRGGKRKREESGESEEESDVSTSYTPLPTVTKSGRNVNKPSQFNPAPEASPETGTKRRRSYRRGPEFTLCMKCQRGHSPVNNMIVFCDGCNTAYHQWCHDPQIPKEVVEIAEMEWVCGKCMNARETEKWRMEDMVSGEDLTADERTEYLSSLSSATLASLLIHATSLYPKLPIFAPNTRALLQARTTTSHSNAGAPTRETHNQPPTSTTAANPSQPITAVHTAASLNPNQAPTEDNDPYHDYHNPNNDPPATYPRPGHGPIKLRPTTDPEDLPWLLDENHFEVFSHLYNDGSGNLVPVNSQSHQPPNGARAQTMSHSPHPPAPPYQTNPQQQQHHHHQPPQFQQAPPFRQNPLYQQQQTPQFQLPTPYQHQNMQQQHQHPHPNPQFQPNPHFQHPQHAPRRPSHQPQPLPQQPYPNVGGGGPHASSSSSQAAMGPDHTLM